MRRTIAEPRSNNKGASPDLPARLIRCRVPVDRSRRRLRAPSTALLLEGDSQRSTVDAQTVECRKRGAGIDPREANIAESAAATRHDIGREVDRLHGTESRKQSLEALDRGGLREIADDQPSHATESANSRDSRLFGRSRSLKLLLVFCSMPLFVRVAIGKR